MNCRPWSAGTRCWTATGAPSAGTGAVDAARWLGGFAALQSRRDGYRLLYGSPDLAALVHDGQKSAIRATAAATRRVEADPYAAAAGPAHRRAGGRGDG